MTPSELALICMVYFATSVISVVTGATSLITVPVLLSFGVAPLREEHDHAQSGKYMRSDCASDPME